MLKSSIKLLLGQNMQVDDALLSRLEKLSFLKVDDDKRAEIVEQLSEIVGFVDNLSELNTENVDANFAMSDNATPLIYS